MKPVTLEITVQSSVYTHCTDRDVSQHVNVQRKTAILCTAVLIKQATYVLGMLFALCVKNDLYNKLHLCENENMITFFFYN